VFCWDGTMAINLNASKLISVSAVELRSFSIVMTGKALLSGHYALDQGQHNALTAGPCHICKLRPSKILLIAMCLCQYQHVAIHPSSSSCHKIKHCLLAPFSFLPS
jgi:hypothetical protein